MFESTPFERLLGTTLGVYRLEQLLNSSELGPIFLAQSSETGAAYQLRVLAISADLSSNERDDYLQRLERSAQHVAALQHPNILPLVDYGYDRGLAYLVSPQLPLRSLSSRLAQNGPLDPLIAGRYLDQIAGALEYAHERATLHRNLTTDCIFLQLDGQILVADFGVRRMIELSERSHPRNPLYYSDEACAPEQLLGKGVEKPADVYALGAALYRMLTGYPVFVGNTREEIAEQHVYAPVPSLAARRPGLPAELDDLLRVAMAKTPETRFQQPGAFANAYHQIVSPQGSARAPFAVGARTAQGQGRPQQAVATPVSVSAPYSPISRVSGSPSGYIGNDAQRAVRSNALPYSDQPAAESDKWRTHPLPPLPLPLPSSPRRLSPWRIAAFVAVILAVLVGGILALHGAGGGATGVSASGEVTFTDSHSAQPGHTDALSISISHLSAPQSGYVYAAWLINTQSEQVLRLGTLAQRGGVYTLSYAGSSGTTAAGTNLLGAGNVLEVTLEHGVVNVPVGAVQLMGTFPAQSFVHVQHLLVAFPDTPGKIGLLVGLLQQTQLLQLHAQALQRDAASQQPTDAQCEAQTILNILEGAKGAHYQPLSSLCLAQDPTSGGDGFGMLSGGGTTSSGYISDASEHASLAATQPDATSNLRTHAALVTTTLNNVQGWAATLDRDAVAFLGALTNTSKAQELVALANQLYQGVDTNHDGHVDPVAGEGGVLTAYQQAQLMATLTLAQKV